MKIKGLVDEDVVNYKQTSMFIILGTCDWKCCIEGGFDVSICQNSTLAKADEIELSIENIYHRYINNPITEAIVIGGLEPMTQFVDVYKLIQYFRQHNCNDTFVIYTGYYPNEIIDQVNILKQFDNIIIKFGRYIPNQSPIFDNVLGIELASNNQYACYINDI